MGSRREKLFFVGVKGLAKREGKLLLLKADVSNHLSDTTEYWDLPGGRIEQGANEQETLARELSEEIGLQGFDGLDPEYIHTVISKHEIPISDDEKAGLILRVWRVEIGRQALVLSAEHTDYGWFAPGEAAKLLSHKYPEDFCRIVNEL